MRRVLERLMSIGAAPVSAVDAGHGARSPSGRKAYHPGNCARGAERIAGPVAAGAGRRARRTLAQVRNQLLAWHLEPPRCPGATPGELQRRGGQPRALLRRGSRRVVLTAEMRASAERWRRSHTSFVEELPGKPVRGPNALSLRLWAAAKASRLSL